METGKTHIGIKFPFSEKGFSSASVVENREIFPYNGQQETKEECSRYEIRFYFHYGSP
jgi:hypothetical protein